MSAIQFIEQVGDKFQITKAASEFLSKIRTPVSVVCVAGPYRSGKSFLLNRLIGQQQGFAVAGSTRSCTRGIWMWGAPVMYQGRTFLFLDSEGLGSVQQSQTFDTSIFSLSMLLSSTFVLNTTGAISENNIEQLDLVVQCTKQIRIDDKEEKSTSTSRLAQLFPRFLWCLRDFSLQMVDHDDDSGVQITSSQYLEKMLQKQTSGGDRRGKDEKNRIRATITSVFPNRDCHTLVRPITDEKMLQQLQKLKYDELRPEFREQMDELRQRVFEWTPTKQVNGNDVTGPVLLGLTRAYVDAINNGAIPVINTAWKNVLDRSRTEAMQAALESFEKEFSVVNHPDRVFELDELQGLYEEALMSASRLIYDIAAGDERSKAKLEEQMKAKCKVSWDRAVALNELKSKQLTSNVLAAIWDKSPIPKRLNSYTTLEAFAGDKASFTAEFLKHAKGPKKFEVLNEFLEKKTEELIRHAFLRLETRTHELDAKTRDLELMARERDRVAKECQTAVELHRQLAMQLKDTEKDGAVAKKELDLLRSANQQLQQRFDSDVQRLQGEYHRQSTALAEAEKSQRQLSERLSQTKDSEGEARKAREAFQSSAATNEKLTISLEQQRVKANDLNFQRDQLQKKLQQETKQREDFERQLQAEKEAREKEREQHEGEHMRLCQTTKKDKDKSAQRIRDFETERDLLAAENKALMVERDVLASARDTLVTERDRAIASSAAARVAPPVPAALSFVSPAPASATVEGADENPAPKRKSKVFMAPMDLEDDVSSPGESKDDDESPRQITPRGKVGRRVSQVRRDMGARKSTAKLSLADDDKEDGEDGDVDKENQHDDVEEGEEHIPTAEEIKKTTIPKLRSWLTSLNIEFSQQAQPKQYFVDLLCQHFNIPSVSVEKPKVARKSRAK